MFFVLLLILKDKSIQSYFFAKVNLRQAKTKMKIHSVTAKPIILIAAAIVLFMMPGLKLPYLDQKTNAYFSDAMTKAGVACGVCRVVNVSVPVITKSQILQSHGVLGGR